MNTVARALKENGIRLQANSALLDLSGRSCKPGHAAPDRVAILFKCPVQERGVLASSGFDSSGDTQNNQWQLHALADMDQLFSKNAPGMLLVDADWCEGAGLDTLHTLRHRFMADEVVLVWSEPSVHYLELLIKTRARGCLMLECTAEHAARAVAAIRAGELWYPRWVLGMLLGSIWNSGQVRTVLPLAVVAGQERLTLRESQVVNLVRQGFSNKEIAARLNISINTAKKHVAHILEKCGKQKRRQFLP